MFFTSQTLQDAIVLPTVFDWTASINAGSSSARLFGPITNKLAQVYDADTLITLIKKLEELIIACTHAGENICENRYCDAKLLAHIVTLQAKALFFLKTILDVKSHRDLIMVLTNYTNRPDNILPVQNFSVPVDNCDLKPMHEYYVNADRNNKVRYLSLDEREAYRIIISDGKFKYLKKTEQGYRIYDYHTEFSSLQHFMFVIDPFGNIYSGVTQFLKFHHSSFLSGNPVFSAGTMLTNENGVLTYIKNDSGHYMPEEEYLIKALEYISHRGALSDDVVIKSCSNQENAQPIRIDDIKQNVIKKFNPKTKLMTISEWKTKSNLGIFHTRSQELCQLDTLLADYRNRYTTSTSEENLNILDEIKNQLNIVFNTHKQNKQIRHAVYQLKQALVGEWEFWLQAAQHNQEISKSIDYRCLRIK